jgi:hypothetical protein
MQIELAHYRKKKHRNEKPATFRDLSVPKDAFVPRDKRCSFLMTQNEIQHLIKLENAKKHAPRGTRMVSETS